MGGLGLRAASDHASVAHAISVISSKSLVDDLLGPGGRVPNPQVEQVGLAPNSQDALALPTLPLPLLEDITAKQGGETVVTVESLVLWVYHKRWQV